MWFTFLTYNDANDVESHWTKKTGATMDYWFTEEDSVPRYIIIDELNAFYHIRDSVFWKYLKAAESAACPYIKVCNFAQFFID